MDMQSDHTGTTFALKRGTDTLVHISELGPSTGQFTMFSCLECRKRVVPVKGPVRMHHFRHHIESKCTGMVIGIGNGNGIGEGSRHRLCKLLLKRAIKQVAIVSKCRMCGLPENGMLHVDNLENATLEIAVMENRYRIDLVARKAHKSYAIEVVDSHRMGPTKSADLQSSGLFELVAEIEASYVINTFEEGIKEGAKYRFECDVVGFTEWVCKGCLDAKAKKEENARKRKEEEELKRREEHERREEENKRMEEELKAMMEAGLARVCSLCTRSIIMPENTKFVHCHECNKKRFRIKRALWELRYDPDGFVSRINKRDKYLDSIVPCAFRDELASHLSRLDVVRPNSSDDMGLLEDLRTGREGSGDWTWDDWGCAEPGIPLSVPFAQRQESRQMKCWWDAEMRSWRIPKNGFRVEMVPFLRPVDAALYRWFLSFESILESRGFHSSPSD